MNIAKRVVHVAYGTTAYQSSSFEYEAAACVYSRIVLYGLKNRLLNQFPRVRFRKERAEVSGRSFKSSFVGRRLSHLDEKRQDSVENHLLQCCARESYAGALLAGVI